MSQIDREKWNRRYREGAYAGRAHPSAFLAERVADLPVGRALDVACGTGRNALFLAGLGYDVVAVDISREALRRGDERARQMGVEVRWLEHDLDDPLVLEGDFQLVLLFRYVDLALLRRLAQLLAPGGVLLCEEHLASGEDVIGPTNPAFRVKPGELAAAAAGLEIVYLEEGLVTEPDGRLAALSRLMARRHSITR